MALTISPIGGSGGGGGGGGTPDDNSVSTIKIVDGAVTTPKLATSAVTTPKITDAAVTLAKLANLAQATVIGRASGAGTGVPTALTAAQVLAIVPDMVASGASHARGIVPDPGASAGTTHYLREDGTWAIPPGGGVVATVAAGTNIAVDASDPANPVVGVHLGATDRLVGRSSSGAGASEEITCTAAGRAIIDDADAAAQRTTLGLAAVAASGSASDLSTGTLPIARIADAAVTNAKLADMVQATFKGRQAAAGTGAPQDMTASQAKTALAIAAGDVSGLAAVATSGNASDLGTGTLPIARIADGAVTSAKLRDSAAVSVIGRSANSTGVPADIAAGSDGDVLRRSGTSIGFGGIAAAALPALTGDVTSSAGSAATTIANDAVTYAKMQNISATSRVLGRATALAGDTEELTVSQVLNMISTTQGDILFRGASAWNALTHGTAGQHLQTNGAAADPSWVTPSAGSAFDPSTTSDFYEDFISAPTGQMQFLQNGPSNNVANASGHDGIREIAGASNTGVLYGESTIVLGDGAAFIEIVVRIPTLSDGTNTFFVRCGINNDSQNDGNEAVMFRYTHSQSSGNWQLICRSGGTETVRDTGTAVAANTWYRLRATINAGATSVQAAINGTNAGAAVTTNIPTAVSQLMLQYTKTAGATSRSVQWDYIHYQKTFTTPR